MKRDMIVDIIHISIIYVTVICKVMRKFIIRLCLRFFRPSLNSIYFSSLASRILFLRNLLIINDNTMNYTTEYKEKISI